METEQRYKFAEDIRKILCHGHRHLETGQPFAAQASDMAEELWGLGYRPDMVKSMIFHRLHQEAEAAWIQLWSLNVSLQDTINAYGPDNPKHEGLVTAQTIVVNRLSRMQAKRDFWEAEYSKALAEEGFNE